MHLYTDIAEEVLEEISRSRRLNIKVRTNEHESLIQVPTVHKGANEGVEKALKWEGLEYLFRYELGC